MKLLLVDLSSLSRPIWEMSGKEADQDYASKTTVARVHDMAHGFDGVAVCCDSRKSWRKELAPTYKANRPASEEPMLHQLRLAQETLAADGFPVWQAEGFEADDVIASAAEFLIDPMRVSRTFDNNVTIASNDKDLMQLVQLKDDGATVCVKSLRSGTDYDVSGVVQKFGVYPHQMRDWLIMVGDNSDNVAGIKGIGKVRAAELLKKHGSLANIYANLGDACHCLDLTPSMYTNLKEGLENAELARKLITLRTDVELPFADIFKPRTPKTAPAEFAEEETMHTVDGEIVEAAPEAPKATELKKQATEKPAGAAALRADKTVALANVEWVHSLEPANLSQAMNLANALFASRLFQAYGSPEAVLATILAGRELGIGTMSALKGYHIIEGKPSMSADLMAAIVKRSPLCKQFEIIERTTERATIRIWRTGEANYLDVSYSVDDAKRAKTYKAGGAWEKDPAGMCVARCKAIGARLKWEDLLGNVYTPEEMGREDFEEAA